MENNKDIYLTLGRKRKRYEFSMLETHRRRLERLSADSGRSVPDLITEGISLVLDGYEPFLPKSEQQEEVPK
ncbi:hypothetical protein ES705_32583 [subsurface metagenome]|jgi:hypothetical protein